MFNRILASVGISVLLTAAFGCDGVGRVVASTASVVNGVNDYTRAVVQVVGPAVHCSGVVIGPDLVMTAAHCLYDRDGNLAQPYDVLVFDTDLRYEVLSESYACRDHPRPCYYQVEALFPATEADWPFTEEAPDLALLQLKSGFLFAGQPIPLAHSLPDPNTIEDPEFKDRKVRIAGFSKVQNPSQHKLQGFGRIVGGSTSPPGPNYEFEVFGINGAHMDSGDCGGPVLLDEKVIGLMVRTTEGRTMAVYIPEGLVDRIDQDGDGVSDGGDNCPAVANAHQANCDAAEEAASGNYKGDVCDPDPCLYLHAVDPINLSAGMGHFQKNAKLRVSYRGVGYIEDPQTTHLHKNVDGYYCACHDPTSRDPKNPTLLAVEDCKDYVCDDSGTFWNSDDLTDVGWHPLIWTHYADPLNPPYFIGKESCQLVDDDQFDPQDPVVNDCLTPLQSRLFRKPYADAPGLGKDPNDWEGYWRTGHRTRDFEWDWRRQDYPHPETYNYKPSIDGASVRVWIQPDGHVPNSNHPILNHFTDVIDLLTYVKGGPDFDQLLKPLYIEHLFPVSPLGPVDPFGVLEPQGQLVLQALSPERGPEADPYRWWFVPEDSANIGLVVRRYDATSGEFTATMRSFGWAPPHTRDFAAVRWPGTDVIYAFGGRTASGQLSARMWCGVPISMGRETLYLWLPLSWGQMPAGRADAILVPDVNQGRLLLFFGRGAGGTLADVAAFDLRSLQWSQVQIDVEGLAPVHSTGHSTDGRKLYIYGGRSGDAVHDGLYEVDLVTLKGRRIDGGDATPGPRVAPGLAFIPETRLIYLTGGEVEASQSDLWRFDLRTREWQRLQGAGSVPPAMTRSGVVVSPVDGSVSVLAGHVSGGALEPVWRWRGLEWKSYTDLMSPEQ